LFTPQFFLGVIDVDISAVELFEDFALGSRGIDVDKLELLGNSIEPVLDGWVADPKELFHVLDGAVASDESRDEYLILRGQKGQGREFEAPL